MMYQQKCVNAHQILGLDMNNMDNMNNIDEKMLRRCYHKAALKNHPDKNSSLESHKKFQEIRDAYDFVCKYHGFLDDEDGEEDYDEDQEEQIDVNVFNNYTNIVYNLLGPILENKIFEDLKSKLWLSIINNILNKCEVKAFSLLKNLNRIQYVKIYDFLRLHKETLHLSEEFQDKIDVLYKEKICEDECIRIYPTVDDLYDENLYKLQVETNTYYIPLWYHELVYDNSGSELFVLCIPQLEDGIVIDTNNDFHIEKRYELNEIWTMELIDISIGKKTLQIPRSDLKMLDKQIIKITGAGIPKMNSTNIFDVSKKSDVYMHIHIHSSQ